MTRDDSQKPNLAVRSNLYVREEGKTLYRGPSLDLKFLHQVRGLAALKHLERDFKHFLTESQLLHLNEGLCKQQGVPETTRGPIKKDGVVVYGCRCAARENCERHRKERARCEKCPAFKG
jgi:hypothetical protein